MIPIVNVVRLKRSSGIENKLNLIKTRKRADRSTKGDKPLLVQKTRRVKTPKKKKVEPKTAPLPVVAVNTCDGCGAVESEEVKLS